MERRRTNTLLLTTLVLPLAAGHSPLLVRDYVDTVCKPAVANPGDTIPPCVEIETIETLCLPNGTAPIYLLAHQECMCGGSYFSEWPACQNCLYYHGLRNQREIEQYDSILTAASSTFCGAATPTTTFAAVFASIQATFPVPATGATVMSDRAPSSTAVSLYYTATGSQGPGPITGSAAEATATTTTSVAAATTPGTAGSSGSSPGSSSGSGSGSSSGTANPGTTPTTGPSGSSSPSATTKSNAAATMWGTPSAMVVMLGMVAMAAVAL